MGARVCLEAHYHSLWENAINARLPGFQQRAAHTRPAAATRNTRLEAGLATTECATPLSEMGLAAGTNNTYVPRPGSPSVTLNELACLGGETELARVASSRGTVSTTDWTLLYKDELCQVIGEGSISGEGEACLVFDGDVLVQ